MKIMVYCQYVLGIGHLFRCLEICRALKKHEVILVTGGQHVNIAFPEHINHIKLPGLVMDNNFSSFSSTDQSKSVDDIKVERKKKLFDLFSEKSPDVFLVELYPFGRKAFRYEIDPVLEGIKDGTFSKAKVICSLRDILVEKDNQTLYESRVVKILNQYFDALCIHSDPNLITLDETFSQLNNINIPVIYTGFVTPKPTEMLKNEIREKCGIKKNDKLIVASVGGGKTGDILLQAVMDAFEIISKNVKTMHLYLFAGPLMDISSFKKLESVSCNNVKVIRFSSDFISYLATADLSVSMAGYNTCMNIIAAKTPALLWPFDQNREQRLRAYKLTRKNIVAVLEDKDLLPCKLADIITSILSQNLKPYQCDIDLNGAENTARWIDAIDGSL